MSPLRFEVAMKRMLPLFALLTVGIMVGTAYRRHRRAIPKRQLLTLAERAGWPVDRNQVEFCHELGALTLRIRIEAETVALQMTDEDMFGVAWYARGGGKKYRDDQLPDAIRTANPSYDTFRQKLDDILGVANGS